MRASNRLLHAAASACFYFKLKCALKRASIYFFLSIPPSSPPTLSAAIITFKYFCISKAIQLMIMMLRNDYIIVF